MEVDIEKKIKEMLQMMNAVSDLQQNTRDAEISRYHMGFKEALDWVITDVLRDERVNGRYVIQIMNEEKPLP